MTTVSTTLYRSDNAGSSWYARDSGSGSYISSETASNQSCWSFSYTPTSGSRIKQIVFRCKIMGNAANFTAKLYESTTPSGSPVATSATVWGSISSSGYTWVSFTLDIPASTNITSTTTMCVKVYGSWATVWTGEADIIEQAGYTITYNSNGQGTAPSAEVVYEGNSITLPTMTADGYTFLGWSTSFTAIEGITGTYTPTASVTLYAIWKKNETAVYFNDVKTLIFEDMGDTNLIKETELLAQSDQTGKTFSGWSNNQGTMAAVGNPWNTLVIAGETDIYLYPEWNYHVVIIDGQRLANIANITRRLNGETSAKTYLLKDIPAAIKAAYGK